MLAYLIFIQLDPSPETGARSLMWVKRLTLWKWFAGYFPMSILKTVDLDPSKNYGMFFFVVVLLYFLINSSKFTSFLFFIIMILNIAV